VQTTHTSGHRRSWRSPPIHRRVPGRHTLKAADSQNRAAGHRDGRLRLVLPADGIAAVARFVRAASPVGDSPSRVPSLVG
jgi:hypothetical protein